MIRCPECSTMVRVVNGTVRRHHDPTVAKTWCATTKTGDAHKMIDVERECRMSGARVRFP